VAEYQFEPLGSPNFYTEDFVLVDNPIANCHQIFNTDASYNSTKNIKDLTVVPIGPSTYAYLDSEKVPDYLTYNSELTTTPIIGYNVVMDKIRFHFVAGFDFDNFVALILQVTHTENDGKSNIFSSLLLSPETVSELISFNPKPLFLSNAVFDRYIDVLVPSIKNINEEYKLSPTPASTFAGAITPNGVSSTGFIYNNPISIGLGECGKKKIINTNTSLTYDSYEVSEFYSAPLSQSNEFDTVGTYIGESLSGDFIEFYLTFNSGFPEELISILNRRNPVDDWIIVHQLSIFEQVGSTFLNTSRMVFFQEDSYDEPNIVRPVLKNANEAVSMSIEYIARLTNRRNGEQIIREGSFTLISPKKYGKKLINIPLLDKPQSQKVYNKIVKSSIDATPLFIEPARVSRPLPTGASSTVSEVVRTEYIPIFFTNNNISVSTVNSTVKTSDASEEVIFGPGKLRFVLSPFDNILKFKIFTNTSSTSGNALVPLDLNVNSPKYRIVFETSSGKIAIDNVNDSNQENLSTGQIAFNISKKDSETIVQSVSRTMYIISISQDGRETLMYSGEWRKANEQADVDSAISQAKSEAAASKNTAEVLSQIKDKIDSITAATSYKTSTTLSSEQGVGVASIVNKFATPNSKSIQPNTSNAGKKSS
jgi:hypothetical protein